MALLLDTNIVSELRKSQRCDPNVAAWQAAAVGSECFVSAITMMEIRNGILNAKIKNPAYSQILEEWYEGQVKATFLDRVLPVDLEVAEHCSVLLNLRTRGLADALIAATAHVRNLTLVTRNIDDFADCGIKLLNPWQPRVR